MNRAIRGIEATAIRDSALRQPKAIPLSASRVRDNFGTEHADTFRNVQHPDLRADYALATAERDSAFLKAEPHRRACRRQDNPMPLNDSDTALRGSAFLQCEAKPQVVSEAKDNFRKVAGHL